MNIDELYRLYTRSRKVTTDTRNIVPGSIFFALKGNSFNGNEFALSALEKEAAFAVIDDAKYGDDDRCILVPDVLQTLQLLAAYHRDQLKIPVIGITGTNGKTTTKELLNAVLAEKYVTYCTQGNLNNHIGVPLTLLAIQPDVEVAIVEMGANHQREIAGLCAIAKPNFGLITNIGKAHLEGFGGFEGVKIAKAELYDFIKETGGTIFVNGDNAILHEMLTSRGITKTVTYGEHPGNLVSGSIVFNDPLLTVSWQSAGSSGRTGTNLTGSYNLENILAAVAVGLHFGLSEEQVHKGISSYVPGNNRSQVIQTSSNTLICDYYNANPSSMQVAIDNLAAISGGHKTLILGDMFELGNESEQEHQRIVDYALKISADRTIFIGQAFYASKHNQKGIFFPDIQSAMEGIKSSPLSGSTILLKGSRGMKLEMLLPLL
ncbi:UDP-N-acetylmuramoyl-tripeptide--D-alanyl-D-alanine ligase [Arcticibacter sp.]|jgi:UDP-N-acetylmuramoyl-tripeptide--D-alanyl-D-alanine ligase|uniref:UDP-N-acetylmuramoyl-tripeptide--D-alanyl-D- alanine ligase n=1 Tax=Arcticibacter sp. TaxID=1872630 RepID=UPI00388CF9BA